MEEHTHIHIYYRLYQYVFMYIICSETKLIKEKLNKR